MPRLKSPKAKGDAYERELAHYLADALGISVISRAPLSGGGRNVTGGGSADLVGLPGVWVEAKRTERFSPYAALEQADRGRLASNCPDFPLIVSRRNRMRTGESLAVLRLDDLIPLLRAWLRQEGFIKDDDLPAAA